MDKCRWTESPLYNILNKKRNTRNMNECIHTVNMSYLLTTQSINSVRTGVGSGGGGGGGEGACAPPTFFDWGGNGMFVPPPPPPHTHTFNPTFLFSTWIICLYNTDKQLFGIFHIPINYPPTHTFWHLPTPLVRYDYAKHSSLNPIPTFVSWPKGLTHVRNSTHDKCAL